MYDPYSVLGVPRNAGMDEIKKNYRKLSREYHPDANINNPNKEEAEEKFKLVQEAYEQIVDEREHGGGYDYGPFGGGPADYSYRGTGSTGSYGGASQRTGSYGGSAGFKGTYTGSASDDPKLRAAVEFINNGAYREAMSVLDSISEKTGMWYYLRACTEYGMGNIVNATQYARVAVNLEPNNPDFVRLLSQLESGTGWYSQMQGEAFSHFGTSKGLAPCICGVVVVSAFFGRRACLLC